MIRWTYLGGAALRDAEKPVEIFDDIGKLRKMATRSAACWMSAIDYFINSGTTNHMIIAHNPMEGHGYDGQFFIRRDAYQERCKQKHKVFLFEKYLPTLAELFKVGYKYETKTKTAYYLLNPSYKRQAHMFLHCARIYSEWPVMFDTICELHTEYDIPVVEAYSLCCGIICNRRGKLILQNGASVNHAPRFAFNPNENYKSLIKIANLDETTGSVAASVSQHFIRENCEWFQSKKAKRGEGFPGSEFGMHMICDVEKDALPENLFNYWKEHFIHD